MSCTAQSGGSLPCHWKKKDHCVLTWVEPLSGDTWTGGLSCGMPSGFGEYVFADTGLRVTGIVSGQTQGSLVFSGEGSIQWSDGSTYTGTLQRSTFEGTGRFRWANGDEYCGEWSASMRQGRGVFVTKEFQLLSIPAVGNGEHAQSCRFEGDWKQDLMHGRGKQEFFGAHDGAWRSFLLERDEQRVEEPKVVRSFEGEFIKGFPIKGRLVTNTSSGRETITPPREIYENVQFDGATSAGDFAVWYWEGDSQGDERGSLLIDVERGREEYRAMLAQFLKTMPWMKGKEIKIERVKNDELRLMYDLQVNRALIVP